MSAEFTFRPSSLGEVRRVFVVPLAEGGARLMRNAIVDVMEEAPPRTGRRYFIPGTQTKYTASAPGEVPAIREGVYRDSWGATPAVEVGHVVAAAAVSGLRDEQGNLIGENLEYGTSDLVNYGVAVEPRPHIRAAMEDGGARLQALISRFRGL